MKLLGVSKFNDGIALIVDNVKPLTYEEHLTPKRRLLIGDNEDGLCDVLYWGKYSCGPKAFGGANIRWHMKDGTIKDTDGWWWDGGTADASEYLGYTIYRATIATVDELMECYVYFGRSIFDNAYMRLFDEYVEQHGDDPVVHDYWRLDKAFKKAHRMRSMGELAGDALSPENLWAAVAKLYEEVE